MILEFEGGEYYLMEDGNEIAIATTDESYIKDLGAKRLSRENCGSIRNDYGFDEYQEGVFYAGKFGHPSPEGFSDEQVGRLHGFIDGFQKALEILGDKKFSEEDMMKAFLKGQEMQIDYFSYKQSLQQTEFDVEIVMDICGDKVYAVPEPALDADGCLILKKI